MKTPPPSIKGSTISSLVEDIAKLRDAARIPKALLDERLTSDDRALLDRPINLAGWYDVHSYRRLAELLCEVVGRRDDLLRERGGAAARRLAAAGLYQQIESTSRLRELRELDEQTRFSAYGRGLKLIATLSSSVLNFTKFEVVVDPEHRDRYCIEVPNGDEMPEALALTTEGFINALAEGQDSNAAPAWKLERRPGLTRYRMTRPV